MKIMKMDMAEMATAALYGSCMGAGICLLGICFISGLPLGTGDDPAAGNLHPNRRVSLGLVIAGAVISLVCGVAACKLLARRNTLVHNSDTNATSIHPPPPPA